MTKQEYITEITDALTIEIVDTDRNEFMNDSDNPMMHFRITLRDKKGSLQGYTRVHKSMGFTYSVGSGIVLNHVKDNMMLCSFHGDVYDYVKHPLPHNKRYSDSFEAQMTQSVFAHARKGKKRYYPSNDDVALCLCNMISDGDVHQTFEDWASDFGYDSDSMKAKKVYDACLDQRRSLDNLFNKDWEWWMDAREAIDC